MAISKADAEFVESIHTYGRRIDGLERENSTLRKNLEKAQDRLTELTQPAPPETVEATHEATHPGFTTLCQRCGSRAVYFENSLGYSAESGGWGSADLICASCGYSTALIAS